MMPWMQAAHQARADAEQQAEPGIGRAGHHRDAAGEPDDARDREVELADQDGKAEPQRHQAEGGEQLHDAEDRADAEEEAGAAIDQRQQDDGAGHDRERPHRRIEQQRAARIIAAPRWCAA